MDLRSIVGNMYLLSNISSKMVNSYRQNHPDVNILNTKKTRKIFYILWSLGYINGFLIENKRTLKVFLKYYRQKSIINSIQVISRPGRCVYIKWKHRKYLLKYNNLCGFLSTHKGIYTHNVCIAKRLGGELLFLIY